MVTITFQTGGVILGSFSIDFRNPVCTGFEGQQGSGTWADSWSSLHETPRTLQVFGRRGGQGVVDEKSGYVDDRRKGLPYGPSGVC